MRFHDTAQLLLQHCNSFQIWRALANEETPPQKINSDSVWLIWRQDLVSLYRALENDECEALTIVMSGGNFADVCIALYLGVNVCGPTQLNPVNSVQIATQFALIFFFFLLSR